MTDQNVPEWEEEFDKDFGVWLGFGEWGNAPPIKSFIRTQIEKAEARGAERAVEYIERVSPYAMAPNGEEDFSRRDVLMTDLEAAKNITT